MATAQKRGFRFPWGSDTHHDEPTPESSADESVDQAALAQRIGAGADLGEGPFALPGTAAETAAPDVEGEGLGEPVEDAGADGPVIQVAAAQSATAEHEPLNLDDAAWPQSDRRTVGPLAAPPVRHGRSPAVDRDVVDREAVTEPVPADASVPDEETGPEVEPETMADMLTQEAPDEPTAAATPPTPPPATAAPSTQRRANPLVAGLVRAMRDAAKTARDEAVSGLHLDAATRAEAIRAQSAVTVGELKKTADADVAQIKEWSRAELVRVREEAEARIATRKTQLVAETEAEGHATEDLLERLEASVTAFEAEMGRFFEALLAEEDPAKLAGLAERMPTAPDLDMFPAAAGDAAAHATSDDSSEVPTAVEAPAAVEADPVQGADAAEAEHAVRSGDDAQPTEATPGEDAVPTGEAVPHVADDPATAEADAERPGWLDHLDADTAAAAEAEALAGLDRQTTIVVSGLASVASIAAFKAALVHVEGVSAVSVTAGQNNDVVYTVTHDGHTELRDAVRSIETFQTHLIADDGDTMTVAAREPAA